MSLHTAAKKSGYNGEIVDFNTIIKKNDIENYKQIVKNTITKKLEANPSIKLIGISILFSIVIERCLELIRIIREIDNNISIVVGGIHATIHYQKLLENNKDIDYVVIGEGEIQFVNLLNVVTGKADIKTLTNGIAYRKNNRVVSHPQNTYIKDINELGIVDYSWVRFEDYSADDVNNWYSAKGVSPSAAVPILTSRACPYNCNFCSMYKVMGKKFRQKSANLVMEELKFLHYEKGINYFQINDDNFTLNKKRAMEILSKIIQDGMKITLNFINGLGINHLNEELIDALVEAGASYVYLAVESGSPFIRNKIIGKKLSDEKIYEVVNYFSKKYPQIRLCAFFIIGFPEETKNTLNDSLKMITNFDTVIPEVFNCIPYYGTRLWEQCVKDNLLTFDHKDAWKKGYIMGTNSKSWFSTGDIIENEFCLTPYNLTLNELKKYRQLFDKIYKERAAAFSQKYQYCRVGKSFFCPPLSVRCRIK